MVQKHSWTKMYPRSSRCVVAELFSPPRFAAEITGKDQEALSFDILQGWDLNKPQVQKRVSDLLANKQPELLVACPPCKHWGGWYHLNQRNLPLLQRIRNKKIARKQADLSCCRGYISAAPISAPMS